MENVLVEIIQLLTGGLTSMAEGIGGGLQSLVTSLFVVQGTDSVELSAFGSIIVIFAGIALAVGLSKLMFHFFTGLGKTGY